MTPNGLPFDPIDVEPWTPRDPPSLAGVSRVALDLETTGLRWWEGDRPIGIAITTERGTQYLPFGHRGGGNLDEAVVKRWAARELRGKHLIGLNVRFDLHFMREWGIDLESQGCTADDVAHSAALLDDHRTRFSLDRLAQEFLGEEKVGTNLDSTRMADYHAGDVAPRAEADSRQALDLFDVFTPQLDVEGLTRVKALENQVIWVVLEMEQNGCPIDQRTLEAWYHQSEQDYMRLVWNIYRDTLLNVNPNSTTDLVKLCHHLHLTIHTTPDGRASFTDAVLAAYHDPVIDRVRHARKLASLRSKYLVKYREGIGSDGILRYALHQLRADGGGTVSGRFSSSAIARGVGVNIQQVPGAELFEDYPIRNLHRPASGQWLSADADQIEYRLFADRAQNPTVLAAYDADPALSFHQLMWNRLKTHDQRITYKTVKTLNFCRLYGGGRAKIAQMLGHITAAEFDTLKRTSSGADHPKLRTTAAIMSLYNDAMPEVSRMLAIASHAAASKGYVTTALGRRARLGTGEGFKALNRIIQGSAADVMKMKLVELHAARKTTGFLMRFTVHDEVCGDCPSEESRRRVHELLNTPTLPLDIPLRWSVHTGAHWGACD
jgi:DNA polymerase-1